MLSVTKLNNNRFRVNQHKTERGILKDKRDEIIEAVALTLAPKEHTGEEKTIDEQLVTMKREKAEKKLLEYQLKKNPQTVSTFLANKYSDGNFNLAVKDRYDNSEERKKSGLTFDYHVYLPMDPRYKDRRGHNKYVLSDTILDRSTQDSYTYHIPMWINADGEIPFFVTDYGEVVDDSNSRGLRWALGQLRVAIDSGRFLLDPLAEEILSQFGFLVAGRIVHDIKGNIFVEKYLKSISPPEKKVEAIKYLDSFSKKSEAEQEEVSEPDEPEPDEDVEPLEQLNKDPLDDLSTMLESEGFDLDPIKSVQPSKKTVSIRAGEYKDKKISEVAKDNDIPVIEYVQSKKGNAPNFVTWLEIFTGDSVYKLGLRTGYRGASLDSFNATILKYHEDVLSAVISGMLTVGSINSRLQTLLEKKGFGALVTGNRPPVVVENFSRGVTV